jgi:hypothetical protein
MPFSAQGRVICKKILAFFLCTLVFLLSISSFIPHTYAQTTSFNTPNTDTNVPTNQHYFTQSVLIEMSAAIVCQLVGIDPINPQSPCLGIDPITNKLGFANAAQTGATHIGGIVGFMSNTVAVFYQQPASTSTYISYLSDNFGIVKKAEAATATCGTNGSGNGYGFCSLYPLLGFWTMSRDLAYFVFVIAFMIIGVGIMMRIKIDPRTVMTIQNQIPRIIVCVLLITFSYAISGLMIDAMWLVTYIGVNQLANVAKDPGLANIVTPNLLFTPISFADKIFAYKVTPAPAGGHGFLPLTWDISNAMGGVVQGIFAGALNLNPNNTNCSISLTGFNWEGCLNGTMYWLTTIVMLIIILVTLIMTMFRLWFELLKAYTFTLLYVIAAPLWIVMGLLPGKPLGFEKWFRSLFVNLATFPAVALMIMLAKIFLDIYTGVGQTATPDQANHIDPNTNFIPPLVGNPNMRNFGVLVAFGILLMTPTILNMLRESLKVPGTKHGSAIGAGLAAGAAVPGAIAGRAVANLNKRSHTGEALGPLARLQDTAGDKVFQGLAKMKVPFAGRIAAEREHYRKHGRLNDFDPGAQKRQEVAAFQKERSTDAGKAKYSNDKQGFKRWQKDQKALAKARRLEGKADAQQYGGRFSQWRHGVNNEKAEELRRRHGLPTRNQDNQEGNGPAQGGSGGGNVPRNPNQPAQPGGAGQNIQNADISIETANIHQQGSGTQKPDWADILKGKEPANMSPKDMQSQWETAVRGTQWEHADINKLSPAEQAQHQAKFNDVFKNTEQQNLYDTLFPKNSGQQQ